MALALKGWALRAAGRQVLSADEIRGAANDPRTLRIEVKRGEWIAVYLLDPSEHE